MEYGAIREMNELVLASSFYTIDSLLSQSPCGCVGELSKQCRMKCFCPRNRLPFHCSAKTLHGFFDFG